MKNALRACILIIFFVSCKTAEFGVTCIDINGMVYDFENRPVPGYEISVGPKLKSVSDITGRFTIQKVPAGTYEVLGRRELYESYRGTLELTDKKQIVHIRVPSATQLLDLADKELTENRLDSAERLIDRANGTGIHTTESVFYTAVLKFRKHDTDGAILLLEELIASGVDDVYAVQFLAVLKKTKAVSNE